MPSHLVGTERDVFNVWEFKANVKGLRPGSGFRQLLDKEKLGG